MNGDQGEDEHTSICIKIKTKNDNFSHIIIKPLSCEIYVISSPGVRVGMAQ